MSVAMWVLPPGGVWSPVGEAGSPRVLPSSLHLECDEMGPTNGSFQIVQDTAVLGQLFVPQARVMVEVDGTRCWSGKVLDVNRSGRVATVDLQGTSAALADAPIAEFRPVDSRLDVWSDDECVANEWAFNTANKIGTDGIVLGWQSAQTNINTGNGGTPAPSQVGGADYNAIRLMNVPTNVARIAVTFTVLKTVAYLHFIIIGYDAFQIYWIGDGEAFSPLKILQTGTPGEDPWLDVFIGGSTQGTKMTVAADATAVTHGPSQAFGHISMGLYLNNSAAGAPFDNGHVPGGGLIKITNITTVDDITQIDGSGNSLVTGSYLAKRLARMIPNAPQAPDLSGIQTTPTKISHFAYDASTTVAQLLGDAAAFDDSVQKLDAYDRLIFAARSAAPSISFGANTPPSQETPVDPSTLISWVEITMSRTSGANLVVRFSVLDLPETPMILDSAYAPLLPGVPYALNGDYRSPNDAGGIWQVAELGNWDQTVQTIYLPKDANSWPRTTFVPPSSWGTVGVTDGGTLPATTVSSVWRAVGPLQGVSRGGAISFPAVLPTAQLLSVAQAYLRAQNRLGYTQTRVVSDGGARDALTGLPLPAASLLAHTNEYARLSDRIDPFDGKIGALGYVSGVQYEHGTRQATVAIGQRYGAADELAARIGDIIQVPRGRKFAASAAQTARGRAGNVVT